MTMTRKLKTILIGAAVGLVGLEASQQIAIPVLSALVSTAEARVGRPLTPVSVAGVARRTVRRCAVGVYNC
jgi:hypothetical protein